MLILFTEVQCKKYKIGPCSKKRIISDLQKPLTALSGMPGWPSRIFIRALDSSHIFLINSPLRPMIPPTFWTGTNMRKTDSPGHPGHLFSATGTPESSSRPWFWGCEFPCAPVISGSPKSSTGAAICTKLYGNKKLISDFSRWKH